MNVTQPDFSERLTEGVRALLKVEIEKIVEEERLLVAKRVNDRVRELVPKVATALLDRFTIERPFGGPELIIRVNLNETSNPNR